MVLHSPFDLKYHFMVSAAGSAEIFTFLFMIVVAVALSKFNFPNKINLSLFALATIIMASYLEGLYVIVILLVGIVTFYSLSKVGR